MIIFMIPFSTTTSKPMRLVYQYHPCRIYAFPEALSKLELKYWRKSEIREPLVEQNSASQFDRS